LAEADSPTTPVEDAWRREVLRIAIGAGLAFIVAWLAVTWLTVAGLYGDPDIAVGIRLYPHWANEILVLGQMPYVDFGIEYPPLAIATFLIPAFIAGTDATYEAYRGAFQAQMASFGAGTAVTTVFATAALGGRRRELLLAAGLVAASPLLMGATILGRFDMLPVLLTALALWAVVSGRMTWAALFIGLGAVAKLYPILLAPFVAAHIWRRSGFAAAIHWSAVVALTVTVVLGLFFAMSPEGVLYMVLRQFERPLQIEAFGAVVLMLLNEVAGLPVRVTHTFDSWNLEGSLPDAAASIQTLASLALLGLVGLRVLRAPPTKAVVVIAMTAALAIYIVLGKAFSPQYVLWLVPFVAVLPAIIRRADVPRPGRAELATVGLLVAIIALTSLYYPGFYWPYVHFRDVGWTLVILARNLLLLGLAAILIRAVYDARLGRTEATP
jgi:Glycosyltransferase family 87